MRYLSVVGDYFRQIHFAEIKSSLRMACVNVNFTAEADVFSTRDFCFHESRNSIAGGSLLCDRVAQISLAATISSAPLLALRAVGDLFIKWCAAVALVRADYPSTMCRRSIIQVAPQVESVGAAAARCGRRAAEMDLPASGDCI